MMSWLIMALECLAQKAEIYFILSFNSMLINKYIFKRHKSKFFSESIVMIISATLNIFSLLGFWSPLAFGLPKKGNKVHPGLDFNIADNKCDHFPCNLHLKMDLRAT